MPSFAKKRTPASAFNAAARCAAVCCAAVWALALGLSAPAQAQVSDLVSRTHFRVCADPANTPFSSKKGDGFENEIAALFAEKLGLPVQYEWFPMATGFIRKTLRENRCDVVIGYAQGHELVLNTNHYYTSTYVLVTRSDSPLAGVDALSDPKLQGKRIGVIAGSPPATHMARNGLIGAARPYRLMVDRRFESPAEQMIEDLQKGEIDAAALWGPMGGYYAKQAGLKMTPLLKEVGAPRLFYRITMGVRQGEVAWKRKLNSLIRRNQQEIDAILRKYGVPLVADMGQELKAAKQ